MISSIWKFKYYSNLKSFFIIALIYLLYIVYFLTNKLNETMLKINTRWDNFEIPTIYFLNENCKLWYFKSLLEYWTQNCLNLIGNYYEK